MKKVIPLLFLLFASTAYTTEQTRVQVYPVRRADVDKVAAIIPLMLSSTNGFSLKTSEKKLIIRGDETQHRIVQQILADLDAPPKNIQVNVEFNTSGSSSSRESGIRPQKSIVIRNGQVYGSLDGRFSNRRSTSTETVTQMLVAMDGQSASLRVGEKVPYLKWLTAYGYRHGYILDVEIEWRDVGSFLSIEPTIISPGVLRVRLTPKLSGRLEDGTRQTIEFTELATDVVVGNGQTISIGGFSKDKEFSSKFLVGRGGGSESSVTGITLTPKILP